MKAYISCSMVHQVIGYSHPAYAFPESSWSPSPEALFEFNYIFSPYIIEQKTLYNTDYQWFDTSYLLQTVKDKNKILFDTAFQQLETKSTRAVSSLTSRITSGESSFPDDDFDSGLLWSVEQIKQTNRDLLKQLIEIIIPDSVSLDEAKKIIEQAIEIKPWLPKEYN